ncbi:MAG: ShlB/FhaC/HecB family hemolysin secretion/activation protein [Simkaniaceae bacterium]|nr:ShlB/FhaC/HecB family hemolysin secretion/activation protein [Candidatus Sacchlamyda saccharinae]
MRYLIFFLTFTLSLFSSEIALREVILCSDANDASLPNNGAQGIYLNGILPPSDPTPLRNELQRILIGHHPTEERLAQAEAAITNFYKDNCHPLVLVRIPEQNISDGILKIEVKESTICRVTFCGNCYYDECQLRKYICAQEGEYLDIGLLEKDLVWINRNPFRDVFLVMQPGDEDYTTNLQFVTKDYRPYRFFAGSDNTGYEATGEYRLFGGIRLGNLFNLDHQLSYQYTTSTDFGRFFAHTGQYVIPLPCRHLLDFYGGYSGIRAFVPLTGMTNKGHTWQFSGRYVIPFCSDPCFNHEMRVGFDYKHSDVNLILDAIPILGNETVITQLALGWAGSYENPIANTGFELLWFISPGDIFAHQSDKDYQTLRPFADSTYTYVRGSITPLFALPYCMEAVVRTEFQLASENLLSSEQFGLGGLDTVRGYDQRILNTDNGFFLSGELRSPPYKPLSCKLPLEDQYERLQLLGFVDYGLGTNHKALPGQKNFFYLLSTGLGFRYYYNYHVSIRLNWGYPIHKDIADNIHQNNSTINYSAVISF